MGKDNPKAEEQNNRERNDIMRRQKNENHKVSQREPLASMARGGDRKDSRVVHYNQLKLVEEPRVEGRPQRAVRRPARLEDFDLDDGVPRVN